MTNLPVRRPFPLGWVLASLLAVRSPGQTPVSRTGATARRFEMPTERIDGLRSADADCASAVPVPLRLSATRRQRPHASAPAAPRRRSSQPLRRSAWTTDCAAGSAAPRSPTTPCRCAGSRSAAPAARSCMPAACASSTTRRRPSTAARPIAEEVKDKQAANFCDYFRPTPSAWQAGGDSAPRTAPGPNSRRCSAASNRPGDPTVTKIARAMLSRHRGHDDVRGRRSPRARCRRSSPDSWRRCDRRSTRRSRSPRTCRR